MYNGVEIYEKNDKVAVLVSPGYGSGWSSDQDEKLAYDKRVVEFWLEHKDDHEFMKDMDSWGKNAIKENAEELFKSWGYDYVYFGGFNQIKLEWVDKNKPFVIREYDGTEWIQYVDNMNLVVFK